MASFEIIPSEERVVVSLFEWYALENNSLSQICDRLNKEGISNEAAGRGGTRLRSGTFSGSRPTKGRRFTASRVSASIGRDCDPHMVSQPCPRRPRSIVQTDAAEQIVIPVPAIVTPELFDAVQEKLGRQ